MEVLANGKKYSVPDNFSLDEFLEKYCPEKKQWAAVALNMNIVSREKFSETFLKPGDRLEILHPVAGG